MKNYWRLIIFFIMWLLVSKSTRAATLSFVSDTSDIFVGQKFIISLIIDTDSEPINAVSVNVKYPADLLNLVDISEGSSIIDFWVDKPTINSQEEVVSFSGIVTGSYRGQGKLLDLVFQAEEVGSDTISFRDCDVLISDGQGTKAPVQYAGYQLDVVKSLDQPVIKVGISDREPPESFIPIVAKIDDIIPNKNFLVFTTEDKNSGLSHYEVREGFDFYHKADSPYLLEHQNLDVDIYVKAVDKAGNSRVVKVGALHPRPWYEKFEFFAIISLAIIILFLIFYKWHKTKIK